MLCFAVNPAKNWEQLATLKTMWKVKFLPTLMIPWHLEVWPAAPDTLSQGRLKLWTSDLRAFFLNLNPAGI